MKRMKNGMKEEHFSFHGEGKGLNEWRNERIESESHLGGNAGKIKKRKGRFEGKCVCEWNK